MIYLDSNVFIYAASDDGAKGKAATAWLRKAIAAGAATSALTGDEVLWALAKRLGRSIAADKLRQMLALPVKVLPVDERDLRAALAQFEAGLDPRDALHVAVALRHRCATLVSSDPDLADVTALKVESY